ncbi:MAG TPA: glycosyltransferase family 1 protein [Acidimicrobiales bacterium]
MRVAFDLRGTQAPDRYLKGGIARWIDGLATELLDGRDGGRHRVDLVGIVDHKLPSSDIVDVFAARASLVTAARCSALQVDVHHVTSPFESVRRADLVPGALAGPRVARVVTLYDTIPLTPGLGYGEHIRRWWQRRAEVVTQADAVVCLGREAANEGIARLGLVPGKVRVVGTGIPRHAVASRRSARLPDGVRAPFFLYTGGSVDPRKNLERLIAAFAALPGDVRESTQLVVASWSPPEVRDRLARVADDHGVGERVRLCGWVSDEVLAALFERCLAVVYPSLHEGFGYPILEAMAAGVPVVASATTGCGEVLGHPLATFDPTRPESIANAIARVARDEELRRALVAYGRERQRAFSWSSTAEGVVRAYEDAARAPRARAHVGPWVRPLQPPARRAVVAVRSSPVVGTPARAMLTTAEAMVGLARVSFAGFDGAVPASPVGRFTSDALPTGAPRFPGPLACLVDSHEATVWAAATLRARSGVAVLWDLDPVLPHADAVRELAAAACALVVRDRVDEHRVATVVGHGSVPVHRIAPPLAWHARKPTAELVPSNDVLLYGGGVERDAAARARKVPLVCVLRPAHLGAFAEGTVQDAADLCDALEAIGLPSTVRVVGAVRQRDVEAATRAFGGQLPRRLLLHGPPEPADLLALSTTATVHVVLRPEGRGDAESLVDLALTARRRVVVAGGAGEPASGVVRLRSDAAAVDVAHAVARAMSDDAPPTDGAREPVAVAAALLDLMERVQR